MSSTYDESFWAGGDFAQLGSRLGANLQQKLVLALGRVQAGDPWLDIATGTGTVALLAARLHAAVTAQDMSERMISLAKANAQHAGLAIRFDVGDCQHMDYPDAAFEVVTSAHGAVFAPDHAAVAGEIARLVRPGGRMAISAWAPEGGFVELAQLESEFFGGGPAASDSPFRWGDPGYVAQRLGGAFELRFLSGPSPFRGSSPAEITELFWENSPHTVWLRHRLGPDREGELRSKLLRFFSSHAGFDGVFIERNYLISIGKRKA